MYVLPLNIPSLLTPLFFKWHPAQPAMLSVNSRGLIYLWSVVTTEKWGAFAAGFEELEENIIYEEKEDEFDIVRPAYVLIPISRLTTCVEFPGR